MKIGYIINTLTLVDIVEVVKRGGNVIRILEGGIYRENFKTSTFGKNREKCLLQDKNIETIETI